MDVSVPAAYLGVILIWSTTPLAIKWSGEGPGFLFAVAARMLIGTLLCITLMKLLRMELPWDAKAHRAYLAASLAIYGAMLCTYWGAQFIPSGLIAVLYGLSPVITGIMAGLWLDERGFTRFKLIGMLAGLLGLALIYNTGLKLGAASAYGILAILLAVTLQVASAVIIKRIGAALPALTLTTGGLMLALPLYLLTWLVFDGGLPHAVPTRAVLSIAYLGAFGSVAGFVLYYYILKHLDAGCIALITLVTPVTALLLGHAINGERSGPEVLAGAMLILSGLALHQWEEFAMRGSRVKTATATDDATATRLTAAEPEDSEAG
jgi:drug/metabolite transporter (DMT)-like permease